MDKVITIGLGFRCHCTYPEGPPYRPHIQYPPFPSRPKTDLADQGGWPEQALCCPV